MSARRSVMEQFTVWNTRAWQRSDWSRSCTLQTGNDTGEGNRKKSCCSTVFLSRLFPLPRSLWRGARRGEERETGSECGDPPPQWLHRVDTNMSPLGQSCSASVLKARVQLFIVCEEHIRTGFILPGRQRGAARAWLRCGELRCVSLM